LGAFALAALTGSSLRFGMLHGFPSGLEFVNVRHAHSHLMYFSWVTPALMMLMMVALRGWGMRVRGTGVAGLALLAGLTTFVPFLLSGYGLLRVGSALVPLSMITSALNGVAWYAFVGVYVAATWGRARSLPLRAFDAAIFLLVLASMGALGLAGTGLAGAADPAWMRALVDFFLDLFGEGWFTLALLGLAYAALRPRAGGHVAERGVEILTLGLVVRSLAALAAPTGLPWLGAAVAIGTGLAGAGLLLAVAPLWRSGVTRWWALPLAFLTLKGAIEIALAWPGAAALVDALALRIVLLHAFLLGGITLGLVAAARSAFGPAAARSPAWLEAAVLALLASLLPLSGAWPRGLSGSWALPVAAWVSLLPAVAVLALVWAPSVSDRRRRRMSPGRPGATTD
jgi:hypothetical protein